MRSGEGDSSQSWRQQRPDLACTLDSLQSLPAHSKKNISQMNEDFGTEQLEAMAEFYQHEIVPLVKSESIGAVGAAATAVDSRLSEFGKAAAKYQQSLEAIRTASLARKPRHQISMLESIAKSLHKDLNAKFNTEINKFLGKIKTGRRGSVLSSADRGIGLAKGARTFKPIQFNSTMAFNTLRKFESGANILGKGLILIDAGVRVGNVHTDYLSGNDWQRRAVVETTGFGFGTAAGLAVGAEVIAAGLGIAMLATPVGWVFIIGSAIAVGYMASKVGDAGGKWAAGALYDTSSSLTRRR